MELVNPSKILPTLFLAKLREQVECAEHLLALLPPDKIDWRPELQGNEGSQALRVGELLGHILECLAGFCGALYKLRGDRLAHFVKLRERPVNHHCGIEEARERMREYMGHIEEGFALLTDEDLAWRVPTVFVPTGEAMLTVFLGNLEHFVNHKHQLFFYLKMMGVPVGTRDLYHFRDVFNRA